MIVTPETVAQNVVLRASGYSSDSSGEAKCHLPQRKFISRAAMGQNSGPIISGPKSRSSAVFLTLRPWARFFPSPVLVFFGHGSQLVCV